MIALKKIDLDKGREVLTHLDEVPNSTNELWT
jgi:hypothetical protein